MKKKSDLFRELGWDDLLIKHYMIDDSEVEGKEEQELVMEVSDSHSMTLTFSAENAASIYIVNQKNNQ